MASASEEIDESWNGKASLKHLLQHQPSSLSGILTFSHANTFGMEPVEAGFTEDSSLVGLHSEVTGTTGVARARSRVEVDIAGEKDEAGDKERG